MDYVTIEIKYKEQSNAFQTIKLRNEKISEARPSGYHLFDIKEIGFIGEDGVRVVILILSFEKVTLNL
jgi:hypothetical protein